MAALGSVQATSSTSGISAYLPSRQWLDCVRGGPRPPVDIRTVRVISITYQSYHIECFMLGVRGNPSALRLLQTCQV
ncbi:hypothetical protein CRG98_004671 [Punica granatum]|uniref:Uncharacterized protein n=1 Tax=Punica granatum TaxID=22663 RepID=A0A2I0L2G4_PUNGR|nr:hypothetical protein CRG98_004671 [Punica granatum]